MKKKLFVAMLLALALTCLFAVAVTAETVYVNSNGEQVAADDADVAYEFYLQLNRGEIALRDIYVYDTTTTKIIVPAITVTFGSVEYDLTEQSYIRLSYGYNSTLQVYPIADKDAETKTSLHTQITEMEFYIPVLADGASSAGNLNGYSALKKLSFYDRAYEPQSKGGFLANCDALEEIHFYGQNNVISSNFFAPSLKKVVFHKGSTSTMKNCAMQSSLNSTTTDCTVYLNEDVVPSDTSDPRLVWAKKTNNLKLVILVDNTKNYTAEEIASYQTIWQAGNNKNANNYKFTASIQTYCDFYDGHLSENQINDCVCYCDTCKEYGALANPTHALDYVMEYANGYNKAGTKTTACTNEGCTHVDSVVDLKVLFETRGYSKDTESSAIVLDFTANKDAIEAYEAYLKTINEEASINFGVAVALGDNDDDVTNDVLFDENGEQKAGTVVVKFNDKSYTNIQTKIIGIDNAETALHLSGYVNVSGVITYINGEETNDYSQKVNYGMFEE